MIAMVAPRRNNNEPPVDTGSITINKKEYTMVTPHVIAIDDTEAHEVLNRKREAKPSIYHDDVKVAAKERGKMYGIKPQPDQKTTTILSQLRIAAKAHGVKLKIVDRVEERGYVGFIVLPDVEKTSE